MKPAPAIKIYLSNLGQDQDIERGKSLGAASYIVSKLYAGEVLAHVLVIKQRHGV